MKKVLAIILIFIILLLNVSIVNAAEAENDVEQATAEMSFITPETLQAGTKQFTASIYLGKLTNIDAGKVVGYTATLIYDKDMVEDVTLEQQNGWTVTLSNGAIVASIDDVEANKETAKITFTLKDGIEAGKELNLSLSNVKISNDVNLNQTFNFSKKVTFKAVEQPKDETAKNKVGNKTENNVENKVENKVNNVANKTNVINNVTSKNAVKSNTTSNQSLPKAGQKNFIIFAIFVTVIVGVACVIRAKTIKLK